MGLRSWQKSKKQGPRGPGRERGVDEGQQVAVEVREVVGVEAVGDQGRARQEHARAWAGSQGGRQLHEVGALGVVAARGAQVEQGWLEAPEPRLRRRTEVLPREKMSSSASLEQQSH